MSKLRSLILIIIFIAFNWCLPLACPSVRWNTYMQSARPQSSCLSEWHAFVLTRIWFLDGNSSTLIGWPGRSNEWMSWSDWLFCFNRVHYKLNGFAQFFFWSVSESLFILTLNCYSLERYRFIFRSQFQSIYWIHIQCMRLLIGTVALVYKPSTFFNLILIEFRWNLLVCKVIVMFLNISILWFKRFYSWFVLCVSTLLYSGRYTSHHIYRFCFLGNLSKWYFNTDFQAPIHRQRAVAYILSFKIIRSDKQKKMHSRALVWLVETREIIFNMFLVGWLKCLPQLKIHFLHTLNG